MQLENKRGVGIGMAIAGIPFLLAGLYMMVSMEGFLYFIPIGVAAILFFQGVAFIFEKKDASNGTIVEQKITPENTMQEQTVPQ